MRPPDEATQRRCFATSTSEVGESTLRARYELDGRRFEEPSTSTAIGSLDYAGGAPARLSSGSSSPDSPTTRPAPPDGSTWVRRPRPRGAGACSTPRCAKDSASSPTATISHSTTSPSSAAADRSASTATLDRTSRARALRRGHRLGRHDLAARSRSRPGPLRRRVPRADRFAPLEATAAVHRTRRRSRHARARSPAPHRAATLRSSMDTSR